MWDSRCFAVAQRLTQLSNSTSKKNYSLFLFVKVFVKFDKDCEKEGFHVKLGQKYSVAQKFTSQIMETPFCYQFRLILIGDSTVGKSSLLKSFTDSKFCEISDPTVGVDFFAHLIEVADGTRIKLQCWDTGE